MLTGQIAPSVPFLVTPAHSPQQVEKAAKTRFLAKDVRETQELISCRTVRCHGRESERQFDGRSSVLFDRNGSGLDKRMLVV
jgi:hypothetical protein